MKRKIRKQYKKIHPYLYYSFPENVWQIRTERLTVYTVSEHLLFRH